MGKAKKTNKKHCGNKGHKKVRVRGMGWI